ncbi:MAG: hypothetical protein A2901_05835 [Elusimicrobia bacterium RIFCSPLOWO2_01_FULL_54_10]|nr:MAG: hypothetical protein A2901_05835 [Elusimicrobia bacterium RIFCSPLOWO2_01_FULL_54_10]
MAQAIKKIRVLLVDDHPVVRVGIKASLEVYPGIKIVGEASDGREAVRKAKQLSPDVILMDIHMPKMSGLEATKIIHKMAPKSKILVHTMYDNHSYVMESIRAGAQGYILKNSPPNELHRAIESVTQGNSFFSSSVTQNVLEEYAGNSKTSGGRRATDISPREREVLALIAEGLSNKDAAERLCVSVRTIESHRENIMRKLDLHNTAWLTRYAVTHKIVTGAQPLKI